MKNLKKIFMALLCVMIISVGLTGCDKTSSQIEAENQEAIKAANLESVRTYTGEHFPQFLTSIDSATFEQKLAEGQCFVTVPFSNDLLNRMQQFEGTHGKIKDVLVQDAEKADNGFVDRMILTGEDGGQMQLTINYDKSLNPISASILEYSDDSKETLGSKMATAGSNTITGLLVVFCVLVGLSLIISCFRFLQKGGEVKPQKKDAPKKSAPAPAPAKAAPAAPAAPVQTAEEIDLAKNAELVAVIAAAIAASEGTQVEGYVVRSIKRLHNNKWR